MSWLGSLIGGIAGGVNKPATQINYTPPGFSGGGLSTTFSGGNYGVTASPDRMNLVGGVANTFGQQASALGDLRSTVTPGFSQMRTAALSDLDSARTSALGDLRDNLAKRRVLGSSFASDALTRADRDFQAQRQDVIAKSYLAELSANQTLIQQQYEAARGQFQTGLNELNLEAGIAADLTGKASTTLASVANTQAQLDAWFQANKAQFFAGIGGAAGSTLFGTGNLGQLKLA